MAFTHKPLEFIFFDIGGTLGEYDSAIGKLIPFPSTPKLLAAVRDDMELRIGVITTLRDMSNSQGFALLAQAGLAEFLDPDGTSHRPHPHPKQTRS
jgi:hypothetical protein